MFVVVWEYEVKPDRLDEFERAYGPDGDWVALFRRCQGFIETELLKNAEEPLEYATVDYWRSAEHYVRAIANLGEAYGALDARCGAFTLSERRVGNFVKL
jgi:hypothetical protein